MVRNSCRSWSLSHRMPPRRKPRTVEQLAHLPPLGGGVACRIRKNQTKPTRCLPPPLLRPKPTTGGQTGKPGTLPSGFRMMRDSTMLPASAAPMLTFWRCCGSVDRLRPQTGAAGTTLRSMPKRLPN